MMCGIGLLLAASLLTPQESELKAALPDIFAKSAAHYRALDAAATQLMKGANGAVCFPRGYDAKRDALRMVSLNDWTNGHYAGALWYLYECTGDDFFKERATVWTEALEPNRHNSSHHDTGFIM